MRCSPARSELLIRELVIHPDSTTIGTAGTSNFAVSSSPNSNTVIRPSFPNRAPSRTKRGARSADMPKSKRRSSGKVKPTRPCTYELGYVRQDLYACRKCSADANGVQSGFCAGCRETCHAGHLDSVIELYTKRSFRCDCGNTRDKITCLLCPNKEDLNIGNERCYSHNFEGRYCRCDREYDYMLEMAQCAMCEDWFHEECYKTDGSARGNASLPAEYELICKDCVKKLPVLGEYYERYNAWSKTKPPSKSGTRGICTRPKGISVTTTPGALDYIWKPGFRLGLCKCNNCMELYKAAKALYIVDHADFVGVPDPDESNVLRQTDDEAIVNDVLEAEEAERRKEARNRQMNDRERIPRKPLPPQGKRVSESIMPSEVIAVRRRINDFLRRNIESDGGNLDRESVLGYLNDLKSDLINTLRAELRS